MRWAFALLFFLVACQPTASGPVPQSLQTLTISGTGGTTPLLEHIATNFSGHTSGYHLKVFAGTSVEGCIQALENELIDIALLEQFPPIDTTDLTYVSLGYTPEVIIVNASVGITELTLPEVRAVFRGEIDSWARLGGNDLPVRIFVQNSSSPHTAAIRSALLTDIPFDTTAVRRQDAVQVIDSVTSTAGAIGYAPYVTVELLNSAVSILVVGNTNPFDPAYPGLIALGLVYEPSQTENVRPLQEWLQSESAFFEELKIVP